MVDLLPPGAPDFGAVLSQFQRRMKTVLSSPVLATLALREAEQDAAAAKEEEQRAEAAQPKRGGGLFRCFSRPAVLDDPPAREPSARGGSARGGSRRGDCSAYSGRASGDFSARSGISLRGGSERSVRAGCPRDPSVRGYLRATSVEVLAAVDTALWSPVDFGHTPSLSSRCSEDTSGDSTVDRYSPRSMLDAYGQGLSVASLSSEDDSTVGQAIAAAKEAARRRHNASVELPRAYSVMLPSLHTGSKPIRCAGRLSWLGGDPRRGSMALQMAVGAPLLDAYPSADVPACSCPAHHPRAAACSALLRSARRSATADAPRPRCWRTAERCSLAAAGAVLLTLAAHPLHDPRPFTSLLPAKFDFFPASLLAPPGASVH